jgi:hemerythrin-like domain-containing protein
MMLAARCAWMILRMEHAQMRALLEAIDTALGAVRWSRPEPEATKLRGLIDELQTFDRASHRPKGVAMIEALRGRSPEADRLIEALAHDREEDDASLSRALALLDVACRGDAEAGARCVEVLKRHREGVLHHLELEDTALCAHTEELLTPDEWSRVVSSISSGLFRP